MLGSCRRRFQGPRIWCHRPHRVKQPSPPKDYYPDILRETSQKNRNPFEVTTQRATLQPNRGNKFNYFYDQDAIQEVTSPKITKQDRPKKKRPQNVQIEQPAFTQAINNPYAQFNPMPNQIVSDDYYKVQPNTQPATTSTSSTTSTSTTSTTSTTAQPTTYFTYNTSPQVEFHSSNGQLYHDFSTAPQQPPIEEHVPRFTTRPPPATSADEEFRMKQYFRQQDAFRKQPQNLNPTNPPPPFEQVHYTPVSLDYDREVNIPSKTYKTSTTTPKQRVTFYTPTEAPTTTTQQQEAFNTLQPNTESVQNAVQNENSPPANHRPSYNQNEILDGTVEYEPNPYQLPSELPPLTPNLPGLVNDLQEKDKQNAIDQGAATTQLYEPEQPTRPTRRPINRVRKPVVTKVTSSVSYSESESSSKRPSHRVRRPYGSRGSASSTSDSEETSTSTTRRPSGSRSPLIRNPNRVRYQPTPEERQTLRIKPRKQYTGSKKTSEKEDLDYQRDVLKQNYPVFKQSSSSSSASRRPTSPTAIPNSYAIATTESPTSETQQVYTVTPSNSIDSDRTFPAGLLEPMQIAQQYNDYSKDNYGPGYFPNQEDFNPTETILRNEINPVYTTIPSTTPSTTTTTTTTEETPATTTRRSPFIRRNYPRLRTTTTEAPTTTSPASEEKPLTRSRLPPRKVIKVRARTRRPSHPASTSTASPEDEQVEQEPKNNYRKLSRFNQDLYENDTPRHRYKTQLHLDGQESQWSPAVKVANSNNFKPVNPKSSRYENKHKFENEPEIVTAGPEEDGNDGKSDSFEVNVSANLGSTADGPKSNLMAPNLKPEKSFAELLEEVMGQTPEEQTTESDDTTRTTDGTFFESQKTTANSNRLNRRGKWKKLRISHNNESFETAESQNLGSQLINSLNGHGQEKTTEELLNDLKITTPMSPVTEAATTVPTTQVPTTPMTQTTLKEYELTTPSQMETTTVPTTIKPINEFLAIGEDGRTTTIQQSQPSEAATEDTATRRLDEEDLSNTEDDLEIQPSLFSEVRKQLHELFAIEENDDQAATAALAAVGRRRQEYTSIKRTTTTAGPTEAVPSVTATTMQPSSAVSDDKKEFHKKLMENAVYATEKSTKVTSETEICYRGRCIRSEDLPSNHKLN